LSLSLSFFFLLLLSHKYSYCNIDHIWWFVAGPYMKGYLAAVDSVLPACSFYLPLATPIPTYKLCHQVPLSACWQEHELHIQGKVNIVSNISMVFVSIVTFFTDN
jgi:hypothetical protein